MGCPRALVLALAAAAAADKRTIQRVGLWHLEKAGGTWVGHVLRRAFPDKFESVCEHCMHGPKALTDPRVWSIGLMREPCDYYLAAWSWGRLRRAGWLLKKMERSDPSAAAEFYGAGDADAARFGAWVRYVNDARAGGAAGAAPTCGLLSARLWAALLDPAAARRVNEQEPRKIAYRMPLNMELTRFRNVTLEPCPLSDCVRAAGAGPMEACARAMRGSRAFPRLDCWLRTDRLAGDLEECLARLGTTDGAWAANARRGVAEMTSAAANRSRLATAHAQCAALVDAPTAAQIYAAEAPLAERFGFSGGCCSRATAPVDARLVRAVS